jgi:hypothetical protein
MAGYAGEAKESACPSDNPSATIRESCQNGYAAGAKAAKADDKKDKNDNKNTQRDCSTFTGKDKENCEKANDKAGTGGGSNDKSDKEEASNECEDGAGFSLRWIACGLIEFGLNLSKFFYNEMLVPLLDDVPVGTDSKGKNSGAYDAWNSFRVLANIILVGAMLILVYGAARGGR